MIQPASRTSGAGVNLGEYNHRSQSAASKSLKLSRKHRKTTNVKLIRIISHTGSMATISFGDVKLPRWEPARADSAVSLVRQGYHRISATAVCCIHQRGASSIVEGRELNLQRCRQSVLCREGKCSSSPHSWTLVLAGCVRGAASAGGLCRVDALPERNHNLVRLVLYSL